MGFAQSPCHAPAREAFSLTQQNMGSNPHYQWTASDFSAYVPSNPMRLPDGVAEDLRTNRHPVASSVPTHVAPTMQPTPYAAFAQSQSPLPCVYNIGMDWPLSPTGMPRTSEIGFTEVDSLFQSAPLVPAQWPSQDSFLPSSENAVQDTYAASLQPSEKSSRCRPRPRRHRTSPYSREMPPRNTQWLLSAHDINILVDEGWTHCPIPKCGYTQERRRPADFKRHLETHCGKKYVCCGEPVYWELGVKGPMHGGCRRRFCRIDALQRHLENPKMGCRGNLYIAEAYREYLNDTNP